ncbi:META domain-containing protein [Psychrobacter sp.]|uniref:META domain-containing protein n=1 Tax=Psychrobacter sp. TaxID=56811 RepID=UPI003F9967D7
MVGKSTKLILIPSVLAAMLALGACQNEIQPAESEVPTTDEADMIGELALSTDASANGTDEFELTAEQETMASLSRYRWALWAIDDDTGASSIDELADIKDQVVLMFNRRQGQNTLSYSVGCNTMSAIYQLQGLTLTIEESMSTKMLCQDLNQAENHLNELMQGTSQLSITDEENPLLTQATSSGVSLVWQGTLTSQAKYDSKGKTVFWAVNSTKTPCEEDQALNCLQVKPITYDEQGIKTSEGEWRAFSGEIEGYQHDDQQEKVLRIQRYKIDSGEQSKSRTAATESDEAYAYVLDAVIESGVAEDGNV